MFYFMYDVLQGLQLMIQYWLMVIKCQEIVSFLEPKVKISTLLLLSSLYDKERKEAANVWT